MKKRPSRITLAHEETRCIAIQGFTDISSKFQIIDISCTSMEVSKGIVRLEQSVVNRIAAGEVCDLYLF